MARKNRSSVYLGYEDEFVTEKYRSLVNFTTNKIGGKPVRLSFFHINGNKKSVFSYDLSYSDLANFIVTNGFGRYDVCRIPMRSPRQCRLRSVNCALLDKS